MDKRYDLVQGKPSKNGKTYWHNVGTMYAKDQGGFDIILDSLPIPSYDPQYGNQLRVKAFEAKDRAAQGSSQDKGFDDDMPF